MVSEAGSNDNLAAVLHGIEDMRMEIIPIPELEDHQVVLRMECVGICGSDVHYYTHGRVGPFIVEKPMVIGHETSGSVVRTGKNVKNLNLGDRVAIEPGCGCRLCSFCKTGDYHLCPDMQFCATPPVDGNLSRFYVHDADFCFKLPDNMTYEEGALMEPLAVGVHSCKRAHVTFGDCVLILGSGPIGLVTALAARAYGATKILIIDINPFRLEKAKDLGVNFTLQIQPDTPEETLINKIKEILGEEPRVSIDCAGDPLCVRTALQVTRAGGVVILVAMTHFEMNLPLASALIKEVDIRGIFRYNNDYPTAIEMVKSGTIDVKPLITHHFKMDDAVLAFKTATSGEGNPIKIMIHPQKEWDGCCE